MIFPTPISTYVPMMRGETFTETLNLIIELGHTKYLDSLIQLVKTMSMFDYSIAAHINQLNLNLHNLVTSESRISLETFLKIGSIFEEGISIINSIHLTSKIDLLEGFISIPSLTLIKNMVLTEAIIEFIIHRSQLPIKSFTSSLSKVSFSSDILTN